MAEKLCLLDFDPRWPTSSGAFPLREFKRLRQISWPSLKRSWRELGLLALAGSILLVLTIFSFVLSQRAEWDRQASVRLSQFNADLTEFVQMMRVVESSQRGYVLTYRREFLEPFQKYKGRALPTFERLSAQRPPELDGAPSLERLKPLVEEKLAEMRESVELVDRGLRDESIARIREGFGKRLMDTIQTGVEQLQSHGREMLWRNQAVTARFERIKVYTDIVGAILVISFSTLSLILLIRTNSELEKAQDALEMANNELEDTVQERTAALKRANDEIQRFAYIVSHDLRSPLVNIMGFTAELETLRNQLFDQLKAAGALEDNEELSREFDEAFAFIKSSIARMDRLIGAILTISREGSRVLHPKPVDAGRMVETITEGLAHQLRERDAEIFIGELPQIVTDRLAMEQIFANLIENAIKFLRPGVPGRITISGAERGSQVTFTIRDNGRGIEKKDHERIFELFRRAGPQTVPGEGMGLAYVMALLRRLGGRIDVESTPGEGSAFIITMPRTLAQPRRKAA